MVVRGLGSHVPDEPLRSRPGSVAAVTEPHSTVGDCIAELERCYPPSWAESWDAVGLAVGDPDMPVRHVLFAVDPTMDVVREAVDRGAQLLVVHHPLFLRGVHAVAQTSPGGRVVATAIRGGVAVFSAHTNADVACPGVSDALAQALGLRGVGPLTDPPSARPGNGGLGRIGNLAEAEPLGAFCTRVASALPATVGGVRTTGHPDTPVRRIAVCGGAGGELVEAAARAGADVLVTADGRHHHVLDAVSAYDVAVVDVAHWASEWPWLHTAASRLRAALVGQGRTVNTTVSTLVTDPWRWHTASSWSGEPAVPNTAGNTVRST